MSCIDLKPQFLSYLPTNPHQASYYNPPSFMKSSNEALTQIQTLKIKVTEFDTLVNKRRLKVEGVEEGKMLRHLDQNLRVCQAWVRRLEGMVPDMRTTRVEFLQEYKASVLAAIEMKLLQASLKFKQAYQKSRNPRSNPSSSPSPSPSQTPNLSRPLFIDQSQQQLLQQHSSNEYKNIEKSITKISQMYKHTASVVRLHELMVDSIASDVQDAEGHVQGGRRNLVEAQRRESRNRGFIFRVFGMLYVVVTVYIVVLS